MRTVGREPLKHVAAINLNKLAENTDPETEFRYLDIGAVGRGFVTEAPQHMKFGDAPSRARRLVSPGDTIVSTVRTYLRAVLPIGEEADQLVVSTGFAVVTPRKVDAGFLSWYLQSDPFVDEVVARSVGVSYPAINPSEIGQIEVPLPSRAEQRTIADYLDTETTRIDTLITKKRRLIDLLGERRWSVLDAVAAGASRTTALKRLGAVFTDGDWIESPYITDRGIRLIQTGNIGRGYFKDQGDRFISDETFHALNCTEVLPGDVLISRLANTVGQACIAPDLGVRMVTSVDVVILRPLPTVHASYLVRYLSSERHVSKARLEARGTTMQRLARSQVGDLRVPLPDLDQQRHATKLADDASAPILASIETLTQQIKLLVEHRRALITAAVTGELSVPGVAA